MSAPHLDSETQAVRGRYPSFCQAGALTPLGNGGGFSGAALWRIESAIGPLCLRAWPPGDAPARLLFRHALMTRARRCGLAFVPQLFCTQDGATRIEHAGRWWELTQWLPGRADFHAQPSLARLAAACTALAQLHTVWRTVPGEHGVCPAVRRRLEFLDDWRRLVRSGWNPLALADRADRLHPLVERAWRLLPSALECVPHRLQRWTSARWALQPCLCDLWHDHLLFEGDRLTGLIDYGAVKFDHMAVDLARMLGSLVKDDQTSWSIGLQAYRRLLPLTPEEEELAHDLDVTGGILGVANWLRWLYEQNRSFREPGAVERRLGELVERLESLI